MVRLSIEAMATRFELVMHGPEPRCLRAAGEEALSEIERLDRQLSAFDPQSDISWINARAASEPVKVEPRLFRLLQQARELHAQTDRAFDITVGPLMRAWGFAGGEGRIPSEAELAAALELVGMDKVLLGESNSTVRFAREGMRIDLGAIGKGYAIEQAVELLREGGVTSALIHGGTSSIHAIGKTGQSPFREGNKRKGLCPCFSWRIAIRDMDTIDLCDSSLSVSAVHGRSFTEGDTEYGHVIDPRTGAPVRDTLMAVVVGPSATLCDALSTALLVLGEEWLPKLESRFDGCRGLVALRRM